MFDLCIVGAGATGLSLLLLLKDAGVSPKRIAMIDPHFDGGDLTRRWTSVVSNTPWSKTLEALPSSIQPPADLPLHQTAPLADLGLLLQRLAAAPLRQLGARVQAQATRASWDSGQARWSVSVTGNHLPAPLEAKRLILAPGADPRSLDLPLSSISLDIALDRCRLPALVKPGQKILQFGTMHSGTLVARNLVEDCSASVTAFYNTPQPFVWDRDGAYDGLKGEAATVADAIQGGVYTPQQLQLFNTTNTTQLVRASLEADWVVYAIGFQPRQGIALIVDGSSVSAVSYDGATGALNEAPAAWGFGVAYPNRAPDGVHWDVSVAAFLNHMRNQLPRILE